MTTYVVELMDGPFEFTVPSGAAELTQELYPAVWAKFQTNFVLAQIYIKTTPDGIRTTPHGIYIRTTPHRMYIKTTPNGMFLCLELDDPEYGEPYYKMTPK